MWRIKLAHFLLDLINLFTTNSFSFWSVMCKIIKHIVAISMVACIHNVASAVAINLQENFYADPTVTFHDNGFSATLAEDSMLASVLLVNDPYYIIPDPIVIVPEINTALSFDYDFAEGLGNDDEFRVTLLDSTNVYELLFTNVSDVGKVSFDLSGFADQILGLQFELRQFDNDLDSIVTISNVKLEKIPESSTTFLLLFGSLLCLRITRRLM